MKGIDKIYHLVAGVAIGIEIYDHYSNKGTAEILDIVYTIAGWCIAFLILMI